MSRKPPRLRRVGEVDLPVVEASGLAVLRSREGLRVLVVGDRSTTIAVASVDGGRFGGWEVVDLSTIHGWPRPDGDSQFESIAVDGGTLVAVMSEDPPTVLVGDRLARRMVARISLAASAGSPLAGAWDDPSSRGEGLVLLRGGRLLVAKEKRPPALIEFTPPGGTSRGASRDDFLAPGELWEAPAGDVEFEATAMWELVGEARDAVADISALAVGGDRSLWLLSDKSETVARLSLATPLDGAIERFDEVWRLPKHSRKPEGVAALDDGRVLIAMDTDSTTGNGMLVERPTRA